MAEDLITWKNSYSVGYEIIDNQHKHLIEITNELFLGCKKGKTAADVAFLKAVRQAVEYAKIHFRTEENVMQQIGYPGFHEHKGEHEVYLTEILHDLREFEKGKVSPFELARFLKAWILKHIAETDKKIAPYLVKI